MGLGKAEGKALQGAWHRVRAFMLAGACFSPCKATNTIVDAHPAHTHSMSVIPQKFQQHVHLKIKFQYINTGVELKASKALLSVHLFLPTVSQAFARH